MKSSQVRTVMALLALSAGRAVSTSVLIDELWPEVPVQNARNALQASLTRLRRMLAVAAADDAVLVRTVPGGYVLDIPRSSVDAHAFSLLVDQAADISESNRSEALAMLQGALALWRGPSLADVIGGPQLRAEQVRLDEMRLAAMESVAELRLKLGVFRPVVSELKRLVEIHPERERFSELLMLALYRGGQQAEALAVFGNARARLSRELGLEPGRDLRRMQQAILSQDARLDG